MDKACAAGLMDELTKLGGDLLPAVNPVDPSRFMARRDPHNTEPAFANPVDVSRLNARSNQAPPPTAWQKLRQGATDTFRQGTEEARRAATVNVVPRASLREAATVRGPIESWQGLERPVSQRGNVGLGALGKNQRVGAEEGRWPVADKEKKVLTAEGTGARNRALPTTPSRRVTSPDAREGLYENVEFGVRGEGLPGTFSAPPRDTSQKGVWREQAAERARVSRQPAPYSRVSDFGVGRAPAQGPPATAPTATAARSVPEPTQGVTAAGAPIVRPAKAQPSFNPLALPSEPAAGGQASKPRDSDPSRSRGGPFAAAPAASAFQAGGAAAPTVARGSSPAPAAQPTTPAPKPYVVRAGQGYQQVARGLGMKGTREDVAMLKAQFKSQTGGSSTMLHPGMQFTGTAATDARLVGGADWRKNRDATEVARAGRGSPRSEARGGGSVPAAPPQAPVPRPAATATATPAVPRPTGFAAANPTGGPLNTPGAPPPPTPARSPGQMRMQGQDPSGGVRNYTAPPPALVRPRAAPISPGVQGPPDTPVPRPVTPGRVPSA